MKKIVCINWMVEDYLLWEVSLEDDGMENWEAEWSKDLGEEVILYQV